jgi:IS30 family transposase
MIIGRGYSGALVSLTERKSRLVLIVHVPSKAAEGGTRAVLELPPPTRAPRAHPHRR